MDIDDGSIVKWEVSSLNPAELTVTKAGQSQTVTLSGNSALAEPVVIEDTAPAYIIAHGPLAYWDYYLTNYDDDGNLRVEPAKTTFSLSDDVVSDVPAFYSPDAELCEGDRFGEVVGEAVIMFNYNTDAEKAWFDAIPDNQAQTVQLVSYDGNKTTFNDSLTYVKAAGISHGGGSVGRITVALGHENFRTNGRYYIRIRSAGHDTALVPTHVVNEQAPTLKLSGSGTVQSGQNVSFEIENMTYGITNPTYAAELKRPDGETVALEMKTDWYQIGDRLTLYNDVSAENGRNNIPYNGTYTLTVHSNGFKDMSITFNVTGGEDAPQKNVLMTVDAFSRVTGGGTSGGESGSGGGSISANLKFDADLLINAKVLKELGIENEAAQGINDRWEYDMAGWDSVWTEDGRPVITVNNSEGDFLKHLTNVTLHKPDGNTATVDAQGVQSNTEYYTASGNTLTIVDTQGTLLNENGEYYVALEAEYYNRLTTPAFTVQGDLKAASQPETGSKDGANYTLTFASVPYDWKDSLSVTVNGQTYTQNDDWPSNVSAGEFEWNTGAYGGDVLTMHPSAFESGENTITLSVTGYEPLTVKVSGETGKSLQTVVERKSRNPNRAKIRRHLRWLK